MSMSDLFPETYRVIIDSDTLHDGNRPRLYCLDAAIRECNRRSVIAECHAAVTNYEGLVIYQALLTGAETSPTIV